MDIIQETNEVVSHLQHMEQTLHGMAETLQHSISGVEASEKQTTPAGPTYYRCVHCGEVYHFGQTPEQIRLPYAQGGIGRYPACCRTDMWWSGDGKPYNQINPDAKVKRISPSKKATHTTGEKRKRGRPAMTEEQKAEARRLREEKKHVEVEVELTPLDKMIRAIELLEEVYSANFYDNSLPLVRQKNLGKYIEKLAKFLPEASGEITTESDVLVTA